MRATITFEGDRDLAGILQQIREAGEDPRPAFEEVADFLEDRAASVFRTRGASIGQRWRPLSAEYVRRRRPGPIGVQTGVLRRSLTARSARFHKRRVNKRRVEVVSTAPHAHLFAEGRNLSNSRGGQPARPLVNIRKADRKAIAGILQRHLTGDR